MRSAIHEGIKNFVLAQKFFIPSWMIGRMPDIEKIVDFLDAHFVLIKNRGTNK